LTAITKKRWTIEFCNRLIAEGINIKWSLPSGTRSEALDSETLGMLKRTNCNYLVYAPESGSPETLVKIKKRIELDKLTDSVLEAKRQGIIVRTNLIIGFPHETRRNIYQTIRYGLYLAWKGADEVTINIFSPYPGTEIFAELQEKGRFAIGDDYFLALTSLNSDYTAFNPLTCNDHVGAREMAIYRIGFMLTNYIVGYVRFPSRIWRTIRNIFFSDGAAATVFEHRIKDARKKAAARRVGTQVVG
jgi:anaerobic magnesium-protoporphyrin IX monomethyl ester cyclase